MSIAVLNIRDICAEAYRNSESHGFWEGEQNFPEKLALIHSEVSEALEAYRAGAPISALQYEEKGQHKKPVGIPSELADIVIRVADLCGAYQIDLEKAIRDKMEYNATRPHKHGKVC